MKPTIYLYNLRNEKGRQIEMLCLGNNIACRHVNPDEYGKYIGYIAEIEGFGSEDKSVAKDAFASEMLIFKGFDQEYLGNFLAKYRQAGIATIPLKASLTPTNIKWSSIELHAELNQEYQEFLKQSK